jgi:hypothetical protein
MTPVGVGHRIRHLNKRGVLRFDSKTSINDLIEALISDGLALLRLSGLIYWIEPGIGLIEGV